MPIPVIDVSSEKRIEIGDVVRIVTSGAWEDREGTVVDWGLDSDLPGRSFVTVLLVGDDRQVYRVRFPRAAVARK